MSFNCKHSVRLALCVAMLQLPVLALAAEGADDESLAGTDESIVFQKEQVLPNAELNGDILQRLVLSEIAAQQGQLGTAFQGYLSLAQQTHDPRIAQRAANFAVYMRQPDKMLVAARLWAETAPNSVDAMRTLVGVLAGSQEGLGEIEKPLAGLLARQSKEQPKLLLQLNRLFERYPDKAPVAALVERLTLPYIKLPEARLSRAIAWLSAGNHEKASAEAEQALALRKDWEPAALIRAQASPKEQRQAAMESLRLFGERYPKARDARVAYARWLAIEKRGAELRPYYAKLLKDFPKDHDIIYTVAALAAEIGDIPTAEKQLRFLISQGYRDPDLLRLQLAQLLEENKRGKDALKLYESVDPGPQFAAAQVRAAMLRAKSGELSVARSILHQNAVQRPDEASTYIIAEAQILRDLGKTQEAYDVINAALQTQPNEVDMLYESAMLAERLNLIEAVEVKLRKVISLKPDYAHAYNALGYSLAERNIRLDEAQKLIQKALDLAPDDPFIIDSMGWVLYRKGDASAALVRLQQAFGLRMDPEIAAHLGEVLWALGRQDDARRTWEDSRKENPDNEALANVMKRFSH